MIDSIPKTPIFVIEGDDIGVFSSIKDMELQLEVDDVRAGLYTVYDADGRLISLTKDGNRIIGEIVEGEPAHVNILANSLRKFLIYMGDIKEDDKIYNLSFLVGVCNKYVYKPRGPIKIFTGMFQNFIRRVTKNE